MAHDKKSRSEIRPEDVYRAEATVIKERRQVAWSPTTESQPPYNWKKQEPNGDDYVGLALSGGGIRAASVGLGILQTFCRTGFINCVDYLSTVSGGGYIGSHFSSAVISKRLPPQQAFDDTIPDGPKSDENSAVSRGLPNGVRKLIYGGKYLLRPWEATNKYLIGLLLNGVVILSGVFAVAALVTFVWRLLDTVPVREFLALFYINSDVATAFLPFFIFAAAWFVAWMLSYFRYEAEAPGRGAQRLLYFTIAAFLIGCVLLLVNGKETKTGFLGRMLNIDGRVQLTGDVFKWLLGILGASLLPLLRPKKLIQMGTSTKILDRVVFRIATFALLIGVPLAIVGILGMRNISNTASDPDLKLRDGDILSWPAFAALWNGPVPKNEEQRAAKNIEIRTNKELMSPIEAHDYLVDSIRKLVTLRNEASRQADELEKQHFFERVWDLLGWRFQRANPVRDTYLAKRKYDRQAQEVIEMINLHAMNSRLLPMALAANEPLVKVVPFGGDGALQPFTSFALFMPEPLRTFYLNSFGYGSGGAVFSINPARLDDSVLKNLENEKKVLAQDPNLKESLADARLSYTTSWNDDDARGFNQTMLRAFHPECFFLEDKAYRWIVTAGDEWFRLKVFGGALALFCFGLFVDMNRTSLHRFYRNRLTRAYLVPQSPTRLDVLLSDLNTTDWGAPYHLINTTLEVPPPRFLDELDRESRQTNADRRDRQVFLFSKKYCGSSATGWIPTKEYETYLKENISLADAMALSGAASDAMLANSLSVMLLMTALNLSLGQWMPNPRKGLPWSKARAGVLLLDWLRNNPREENYGFVCDGGFADNLGILALLKRRCNVVIAVDSTCDPNDWFNDLGVAIRCARIQDGIQIVEPSRLGQTLETNSIERDSRGFCRRHFLLGRIIYPKVGELPESRGWLIYIKPSFTCDEGADLLDYRRQHVEFPHHSTSDQFYDATQFESYRQMGLHIAQAFCSELMDAKPDRSLDVRLSRLAQRLSDSAPAMLQLTARLHAAVALLTETITHLEEIVRSMKEQLAKASPPYTQFMASCAGRITDAAAAIDEQTNNASSALCEKVLPPGTEKQRAADAKRLTANSRTIGKRLRALAVLLTDGGIDVPAQTKAIETVVANITYSVQKIENTLTMPLVKIAENAHIEPRPRKQKTTRHKTQAKNRKKQK